MPWRRVSTPEYESLNPAQKNWMYGNCAEYALALKRQNPALKFGLWVEYDEPEDDDDVRTFSPYHVFVHDNQHAYDVMGKHPLPYESDGHLESVFDLDENDALGYFGHIDEDGVKAATEHWNENHARP